MTNCSKCGTKMVDADDPNSRDYLEGEWYKCPKCGYTLFLDYEEMK